MVEGVWVLAKVDIEIIENEKGEGFICTPTDKEMLDILQNCPNIDNPRQLIMEMGKAEYIAEKEDMKLLEGVKIYGDGKKKKGEWIFDEKYKCIVFAKGEIIYPLEGGAYKGYILKGNFQSFSDPKNPKGTPYGWLEEGTMTLPNGDVWKGTFFGFELVSGEKEEDLWECNFKGMITKGNGEKEKGTFRCVDNNMDIVVKSRLSEE